MIFTEMLKKADKVDIREKEIVLSVNGKDFIFPRDNYREENLEQSQTTKSGRTSRTKSS